MEHEKPAPGVGSWDDVTWEGTRRWQRVAAMEATPEQRLDWLEAMIEIAHGSGAALRRFESEPGWPAAEGRVKS